MHTHDFPKPPATEIKFAHHYWIDHYDSDGHYHGCTVLQWAPGANQWCHSGNLATGMYVYVSEHSKINSKAEMPQLP